MKKRGEITDEEYENLRPRNAKIARAHGTAKIHKDFHTLPPFRSIIDTTGTTHYSVGKFITEMLNHLTINQHSLKDSFDAAERIKSVSHLLSEGYVFVSLDVVSLFTNVPLKKTIEVVLKRVYEQKQVDTKLKKRTLKKLIMDTCTLTAFSFNGKMYEQVDGVSMGASLGPVLANIIMTELERVIVDELIEKGIIRFYARYVDDTILLVKPSDVDMIMGMFNSFHPNLQFTIDKFENKTPHFLDLEIHPGGITIYRKDTHTGQYTNFESATP